MENIPEIILIGLAICNKEEKDFLFDELINETLPLFFSEKSNQPSIQLPLNQMHPIHNPLSVLDEVWNLNQDLVIKCMCSLYNTNPDLINLSRICDITQKLRDSLIPIVTCNDYDFAIKLALLAVKRDFLHINQWLSERISTVGEEFIECLLDYIRNNVIKQCNETLTNEEKKNILDKSQLTVEILAIIFENLTPVKIGKNNNVSTRVEIAIGNVYRDLYDIFDELEAPNKDSEEIEEAANKIYNDLFENEVSVSEIIERMKNYRNSQDPKESEIYACMIHSIMDEYRFFHQYPEKELAITANLFGQLINQKLFDGIIETIALK